MDPKKVKEILDMPPPTNIKTLRGLQGRLQSIHRFIAQLEDKFHSFQSLLHKGIFFQWNKKCQASFQQLKDYLLHPPILMAPILGKPFFLYISAIDTTSGALLAQNDEHERERAIYYISKILVGYELNYSLIEQACLAVVFAAQKLRHYMLHQKTLLISKINPLKYLLRRDALIGCLAKWVMILSEFDIEYVDRKAIKG